MYVTPGGLIGGKTVSSRSRLSVLGAGNILKSELSRSCPCNMLLYPQNVLARLDLEETVVPPISPPGVTYIPVRNAIFFAETYNGDNVVSLLIGIGIIKYSAHEFTEGVSLDRSRHGPTRVYF